jgi:hypothetical protein
MTRTGNFVSGLELSCDLGLALEEPKGQKALASHVPDPIECEEVCALHLRLFWVRVMVSRDDTEQGVTLTPMWRCS